MTRNSFVTASILSALFAACGGRLDVQAAPCPDAARVATCDNWKSGYTPVCYAAGEPGPAPAPECAGMGTPDHFGAPVAVTDGMGDWDWWCCPIVEGGAQ